jgi:hypothetical protein
MSFLALLLLCTRTKIRSSNADFDLLKNNTQAPVGNLKGTLTLKWCGSLYSNSRYVEATLDVVEEDSQ